METKKETKKVSVTKAKVNENGLVKKRLSKTMKAAMKFKGAFDKEEVLNYVYSQS